MKKVLSILLSVVMLLSITAGININVFANDESDFRYIVNDKYATITGYFGDDTIVTIPSVIDGYPVVGIDNYAFYGYNSIKSVTIPDSVQYIGTMAFSLCGSLTYVSIEKNIKRISMDAFWECENLYNICYSGTKSEWHSLAIKLYFDEDYFYLIQCSDGEYNSKTYSEEESNNGDSSQDACSDGNHDYKTTIKKATPKNSGYSQTVCTRCGEEHYKYIPSVKAKLSKTTYTYDGKEKKPKVTVYNSETGATISKDNYTVTYPKGRKKVGSYTVKITLKGKYYSGTINKTFKIVKKASASAPAQVKGVSSVATINHAREKVTYTAKWNKVNGADGYQLKFGGEDGGGKYWLPSTKIKKGASNTSYTANCDYYTSEVWDCYSFVKIRAYKIVNGKKVYGKWSKTVYTKFKK